jgi:hypothetical protein
LKFTDYRDEILFEHRFWLQILGDHSRFILNSLSPEEKDKIQTANHFIHLFDCLLEKARREPTIEEINLLNTSAYNSANNLRAFKLQILSQQLAGKIKINLPPTFINHMVNELDEYLLILSCMMKDHSNLSHPLHYHLLWLLDGSGHASSIERSLDMSEKDLIKVSKKYGEKFVNLYLKSNEFRGYMRTGLSDFPALHKLNQDADLEMNSFKKFLKELEKLILDKKVLGTLMPLTTDHMYREECYYLTKLSKVSDVKSPECDPTKPRINV